MAGRTELSVLKRQILGFQHPPFEGHHERDVRTCTQHIEMFPRQSGDRAILPQIESRTCFYSITHCETWKSLSCPILYLKFTPE